MFGWIRRRVIGGQSGKREAALLVFLFVAGLASFAVYQEAQGLPMTQTFALLTVAFPSAVAALLAAHGLEHWRPKE